MPYPRLIALTALMLLMTRGGIADEYAVESLDEAPPTDGPSPEIIQRLSPTGFRVLRGSRPFLDVWLAKEWQLRPGFSASGSVLYPFGIGELIGMARVRSRYVTDFRGQEIDRELYTLRYALQPEDGNHVGTSDTRDFLLMLRVDDDRDPAAVDETQLNERSAEAAGTAHPAMFSMLRVSGDPPEQPTIRHDDTRDLWSVKVSGTGVDGDKQTTVVIELVVVGISEG